MLSSIVQAWIASFTTQYPANWKTKREGKIEAIVEQGKIWRVSHSATTWFARSDNSAEFQLGDWVRVIDRRGVTLVIEKWDDNKP